MSGFVAILNTNHCPIDPQLLQQMTDSMHFRGPDAQKAWADGHVGLGHTWLRTTAKTAAEQQPLSLDDRVWITADARIDGQGELLQKLQAHGGLELKEATHAELILHAYHLWAEDCVRHLIGDFAFAIWDGPRQTLFCARDQFGVKPLFYAHVGPHLIVSNTLDCVRLHPAVTDTLNDLAIANFLLMRYQPKLDITTFADVQRLLPAHTLRYQHETLRQVRYWTLPMEASVRFKRADDYVERFRELFDVSVRDRLDDNRLAVYMSGGMDSTSAAATAHQLLAAEAGSADVRAYTVGYEQLVPDNEVYFAGLVAQHLDIPIHQVVLDDFEWFKGWDQPDFYLPEPTELPRWVIDHQAYDQMNVDGYRVCFTGHGGDPLFVSEPDYIFNLAKHGRIDYVLRELGGYVSTQRHVPQMGIRSLLRRWRNRGSSSYADQTYQDILNPDFVARIDLPKGWWQTPEKPPEHPWRPMSYIHMQDPYWPIYFESYDAGWLRKPIELRFPFFDIRLAQYMLTVPPLRWCSRKTLLREAMRGRLPESVRTRPKSPAYGAPQHPYAAWVKREAQPCAELATYIDTRKVASLLPDDDNTGQIKFNTTRLIALNHWLQSYRVQPSIIKESSIYGTA